MKANLITPVLIVALLGAVSAMTIAGPRVYFAMARDGMFIPAFARVSPKSETPALAIALQAGWSIALVLIGGFEQILMYTGFAVVLSSGAAVAGLFLVEGQRRWREMFGPAVFVVASAAMVLDTILDAPKIAMTGVLFIAAGIPAYLLFRKTKPTPLVLRVEEASGD
jgi:APA family basic amino acid/polyamine antiporter